MECIHGYDNKPDREMLLGCFPFSSPERIKGAWVHGFETNEFYEGSVASPALINKSVGDTELEIDEADRPVSLPKVFQLDFVGRRSRCDMGFPRHIIIVDRINARHELIQR